MIIEITQQELDVIARALDLYESEPVSQGFMGAMLKAAIIGPSEKSDAENRAAIAKADAECRQRRMAVARLRVKLLEAIERPSEFQQ